MPDERGARASDLVDPVAVDRVGDRLAHRRVLDRRVELRVRAEVLRAEVERQLRVGRRRARERLDVRVARRSAGRSTARPRRPCRSRPAAGPARRASWLPYLMYWTSSKPGSGPRHSGFFSIVTIRPRLELGDDVGPAADQRQIRLVGAGQLLDRHLAPDVLGDDVDEQAADDAARRASWSSITTVSSSGVSIELIPLV